MVAFMSAFFVTCARDDVTASRRNLAVIFQFLCGLGRRWRRGGVLGDSAGEATGGDALEGPEQFQTRRFCEPQRETLEFKGVGALMRRHRQDGGQLFRERPYACAGGGATHFLQILGGVLLLRLFRGRGAMKHALTSRAEKVRCRGLMRQRAATEGSSWGLWAPTVRQCALRLDH